MQLHVVQAQRTALIVYLDLSIVGQLAHALAKLIRLVRAVEPGLYELALQIAESVVAILHDPFQRLDLYLLLREVATRLEQFAE